MHFILDAQELGSPEQVRAHSFLLTNGLGGYASLSAGFSADRCDQGVLIGALRAPNVRFTGIHRVREVVSLGGEEAVLSTQCFADGTPAEEGYRYLLRFSYADIPEWTYRVSGVTVRRRMAMAFEKNTAALVYTVENHTCQPCMLRVEPYVKFAPKEEALREKHPLFFTPGRIFSNEHGVFLHTNGRQTERPASWQMLSYPEDEKDGRAEKGLCGNVCCIEKQVLPGEAGELELVFSLEQEAASAKAILRAETRRQMALEASVPFRDPIARQLVRSADAYISRRDSTGGKTILAGYPLFSDWGRDTMIALPGCVLATGRFEDARSILRTFLAYEKEGLVPNLFPEGGNAPMYNTADAALLLIDCVWQYVQRTGDLAFAREAWPVLERIAAAYQKGTRHGIVMDADGLIRAGQGMDQVTWMDVCVQGILPTPRHGKPVEINAYWYNALRILETLAERLGLDSKDYGSLAQQVKDSFVRAFWLPEGYLKDVISGTKADLQIRCNQIWAVSMTFTMLSPEQEALVVQTVQRHLHTPRGLRTLSPEDPEYRGFYGGDQVRRDMAYHQGTAWVFPMGAYYLAWLKVHGSTAEAARQLRQELSVMEPMLREGCLGQLPEIYDGDCPSEGKGCFAQAWSVGEMLRVWEALEKATD